MGARVGKYKFGARVGKHNVGTRAGKFKLVARVGKCKLRARDGKCKLGTRFGKYKLGVRAGKYKLGARAGSQGQGWGLSIGPGDEKHKHLQKLHLSNLNMKDVTENKQFWETIKPFFPEKNKTANNIILAENNQTVREDKTICQIFNTYFINVTKGLKLQQVDESQCFSKRNRL